MTILHLNRRTKTKAVDPFPTDFLLVSPVIHSHHALENDLEIQILMWMLPESRSRTLVRITRVFYDRYPETRFRYSPNSCVAKTRGTRCEEPNKREVLLKHAVGPLNTLQRPRKLLRRNDRERVSRAPTGVRYEGRKRQFPCNFLPPFPPPLRRKKFSLES